MRLSPAKKKKFLLQHPKNQLITKTDLAKFRNTWDGVPHIVSKGAQTNFTEFAQKISDTWDKSEGELFTEKYYQESVAMCLIFRYTESMIPKQSWYQQGYRANIVTYTIALFHKLIQEQFPKRDLDLLGIWTRQSVPIPVQRTLTELSELVYNKLTDPLRGVENVTQWCKREGCWNSIQTILYTLGADIEDCLATQDEMQSTMRKAKRNRRIEKEVDTMTRVVEIQGMQWIDIMEFAINKRIVAPDELIALRVACQLPNKIPNLVQSKKLIALLDRVYEEGYKL